MRKRNEGSHEDTYLPQILPHLPTARAPHTTPTTFSACLFPIKLFLCSILCSVLPAPLFSHCTLLLRLLSPPCHSRLSCLPPYGICSCMPAALLWFPLTFYFVRSPRLTYLSLLLPVPLHAACHALLVPFPTSPTTLQPSLPDSFSTFPSRFWLPYPGFPNLIPGTSISQACLPQPAKQWCLWKGNDMMIV